LLTGHSAGIRRFAARDLADRGPGTSGRRGLHRSPTYYGLPGALSTRRATTHPAPSAWAAAKAFVAAGLPHTGGRARGGQRSVFVLTYESTGRVLRKPSARRCRHYRKNPQRVGVRHHRARTPGPSSPGDVRAARRPRNAQGSTKNTSIPRADRRAVARGPARATRHDGAAAGSAGHRPASRRSSNPAANQPTQLCTFGARRPTIRLPDPRGRPTRATAFDTGAMRGFVLSHQDRGR